MIALLAGCTPAGPWADEIVLAPGAEPGASFGDPALAVNGVRGGGPSQGSTDVYSLTLDGRRPELVLGFSDRIIIDGPGPDFIVFENPFEIAAGGVFIDPLVVEVSEDGTTFVPFEPTLSGEAYSSDPGAWSGIAGKTPVFHNIDDADSPAPDTLDAGGDRFDIADLGLSEVRQIRLRVAELPYHSSSDGPDIDGIYAIHSEESR